MKTQNSQSDPQSFAEQTEASTAPSSATALLSQVKPAMDNDEVSPLPLESGTTNMSGTSAAPSPQPVQSQKTNEAQSAGAARPSSQGDRTGIFRKVQLKAHAEAPSGENATENQEQGFTQIFQSLSAGASHGTPVKKDNAASEEEKVPPFQWNDKPVPASGAPGSQPLAQGEFTRLFHRLDQESALPHFPSASTDERPHLPPVAPQLGGTFTQLLRTLSVDTEAEMPTSLASFIPPPAGGPGEFTRIISGSMLREAQGRTGVPVQAEASQPVPDNKSTGVPAGGVAPVMPVTPAPIVPTPQPLMPQALPLMAAAPRIEQPSLPMQAPQIPVSQTQEPVGSKLQSYIPLLLIANFFLMLLVLILVVFVLLHR